MITHYRAVFRVPGSVAFCVAAFVMRMPIAIYPLGIVLLFSHANGGYGIAGILTGSYIVGGGIGNPALSRLVDRLGQRAVMYPAAVAHAICVAATIVLLKAGAPHLSLVAPVLLMGITYVPVGSLVRARWSYVLAGRPEMGTAYSLESTLDELVYLIGPLIASVLGTLVDPVWGLVLSVALIAVGTGWLGAQRGSEPPLPDRVDGRGRFALSYRGMPLLCTAMVCMGAVFGSVEVTMAAFAGQHGARSATGVVFACFALGSALAGFFYGARHWRAPVALRFCVQALVFAALLPLFLLAGNVPTLCAFAVLAGLGIAPTLITGFGLVEQLVPTRGLTEGLSWALTGLNVGYGAGAATVGALADAHGAHAAFAAPIVAGALMGLTALVSYRRLRAPSA